MKPFVSLVFFVFLANLYLFSQQKNPHESKFAYLGIYATKVNPNLSHQLNLTENLFLNVERVEKNSPAEKAGIQEFDLLLQLDDQILVNQDQLKYLVRSKKPMDEVTITFLRRGKKQEVDLKLGEIKVREEAKISNSNMNDRLFNRNPFDMDYYFKDRKSIRDLIDRHTTDPFFPFNQNRGRYSKMLPSPGMDDDPLHSKAKTESFSSQSMHSQVMITDEEGTLEWMEENGNKSLRVTDNNGKVLFDGPIDTKEERDGLPAGIRKRLDDLEKNMGNR